MRLDKLLSALGIATRSQCRDFLRTGRLTLLGVPCKDPALEVAENSPLMLDGKPLDTRTRRCLMLHKPSGYLTADEDRRWPTVMELLPPIYRALECMPIGRLDKDTTGILLFTTDGQLAHRLISPKRHVAKVYEAQVEGELDDADVRAFAAGIPLKDFTALPAVLSIVSPGCGRVTVYEGKYHQVKRMFGARGKPVTALHRLSFGPMELDAALPPGGYRELTPEEVAALYAAAALEEQ